MESAKPLHLPRSEQSSGTTKRRTLVHSGGTAPVLHRTSLLCPYGHLSFQRYHRAPDAVKEKGPWVEGGNGKRMRWRSTSPRQILFP